MTFDPILSWQWGGDLAVILLTEQAFLQTPSSIIEWASLSFILFENIFKTPVLPNPKSYGAEIFERRFISPHLSRVMFHMSPVTCHIFSLSFCHKVVNLVDTKGKTLISVFGNNKKKQEAYNNGRLLFLKSPKLPLIESKLPLSVSKWPLC